MIEREYYSKRHVVKYLKCSLNHLDNIRITYKKYFSRSKKMTYQDFELISVILSLEKEGFFPKRIKELLDEKTH